MYKPVKFRSAFGYDTAEASEACAIDSATYGPSLTIQDHAIDADINELMRRFKVTGQIPQSVRVPEFGDYTEVGDYRSALHVIMQAQEDFMSLSPKIRAQFNNDPQLFLDFCADKANLPAMREMGLALKEDIDGNSKGQSGSSGSSAAGAAGSAGGSAG